MPGNWHVPQLDWSIPIIDPNEIASVGLALRGGWNERKARGIMGDYGNWASDQPQQAPMGYAAGLGVTPPGPVAPYGGGSITARVASPPGRSGAAGGPGGGIVKQMQAGTRNLPLNPQTEAMLQRAAAATGLEVRVTSGAQPSSGPNRTGSHRHDVNVGAADLQLYDPATGRVLDMRQPQDQQRMLAFAQAAKGAGATGFGAGLDYMGPETMHVGFGSPAVWGGGGSGANAPEWLRALNSAPSAATSPAQNAIAGMMGDPGGSVVSTSTYDPPPTMPMAGVVTVPPIGGPAYPQGMAGVPPPQGMPGVPPAAIPPAPVAAAAPGIPRARPPSFLDRARRVGFGNLDAPGMAVAAGPAGAPGGPSQVSTSTYDPMGAGAATGTAGGGAPYSINGVGLPPREILVDMLRNPNTRDIGVQLIEAARGGSTDNLPAGPQEYLFAVQQGFQGSYMDFLQAQSQIGQTANEPPSGVQEYEFARQQGFAGSYLDFLKAKGEQTEPGGLFAGMGLDAQALNKLVANGTLTEQQALDIAAGKTVTGPNGEILFATPGALTGAGNVTGGGTPGQPAGMTQITGGKMTEDQRRVGGFYSRAVVADQIIADPKIAAAGQSIGNRMAGNIPGVGNLIVGSDYQQFEQAQRDFINAILRRESGAVISSEEFTNARQQYFPQPGDDAPVLAQKAANRANAIAALQLSSQPNPTFPAQPPPAGNVLIYNPETGDFE